LTLAGARPRARKAGIVTREQRVWLPYPLLCSNTANMQNNGFPGKRLKWFAWAVVLIPFLIAVISYVIVSYPKHYTYVELALHNPYNPSDIANLNCTLYGRWVSGLRHLLSCQIVNDHNPSALDGLSLGGESVWRKRFLKVQQRSYWAPGSPNTTFHFDVPEMQAGQQILFFRYTPNEGLVPAFDGTLTVQLQMGLFSRVIWALSFSGLLLCAIFFRDSKSIKEKLQQTVESARKREFRLFRINIREHWFIFSVLVCSLAPPMVAWAIYHVAILIPSDDRVFSLELWPERNAYGSNPLRNLNNKLGSLRCEFEHAPVADDSNALSCDMKLTIPEGMRSSKEWVADCGPCQSRVPFSLSTIQNEQFGSFKILVRPYSGDDTDDTTVDFRIGNDLNWLLVGDREIARPDLNFIVLSDRTFLVSVGSVLLVFVYWIIWQTRHRRTSNAAILQSSPPSSVPELLPPSAVSKQTDQRHPATAVYNNNHWFSYTESDAALVFVHGILSDSTKCWQHAGADGEPEGHWPVLVATDPRFGNIGIYLGGYESGPNSGNYNIKNCADELFSALGRLDDQHLERQTVMQKQKITFVCHSMGGIVARYMLLNEREHFHGKKIGLVLIASPSYGSLYADGLEPLTALYRNEQALRMKVGDSTLKDLDDRFRELGDKLKNLAGIEFYETQNILVTCPQFSFT
jgi:pimeloyl-ACP methyl ester carboxylesterase